MTKIIDIKSLLIGFLLATSVMLFMGATSNNQIGKYQLSTCHSSSRTIYETIIDTETGEIISRKLKTTINYID